MMKILKTRKKKISSSILLLLFSCLLGYIFRLIMLYQRDFWFDEAFTYHIAKLPLKLIIPAVLTDNNPPLYYLFMHYVVSLTHSASQLRLPSLLFDLGTLALLYKIVLKLKSKRTAIYALMLFVLSPLTIYLATTARLHVVGLFFTTLIFWLYLRLKERPTLQGSLLFTTAAIFGIYTQYYVFLIFIPLTILVLKQSTLKLKSWLIMLGVIFTSFLPWLSMAFIHAHATCACPFTIFSLPATLISPVLGGIGEVTLRQYGNLSPIILIIFVLASLLSLFLFWKGISINSELLYIYTIPLGLLSLIGIVVPILTPKGYAIYSPFFFAIVACGISLYKNSSKIILALLSFLIIINTILIVNPLFSGTPIRLLTDIMKTEPKTSIAHISSITYYSSEFYLPNQKQQLVTPNPFPKSTAQFIGGIQTTSMGDKRYWLVDTKNWVNPDERQAQITQILRSFKVIKEFSFAEVSVKLIEQK